ncbi:branched-chain amino acid ABC transporter permease [Lichenihabitans sp. Uapishka_5]|uniref:branched-chain amino acid ABC transporter permease n=1 Tax=Lichenihabitans sp. Uapishka_5 TaxID=3037302 RepID=UPI0029E7F268|nr:branched-chain amino acid ABC transporter permease [Lichenihabitans sp. Uapishka_5]MDX7950633.1 branched-chain amino acid ABC transporter permease [Lichenihabitans sp. Uapishka_5]
MLDILGYAAFFGTTALTYAVICLGLNLQWGQTGLFNVGVAGFAAIGAYATALATTPADAGHWGGAGLPIAVGLLAAMVASAGASAFVGALTLRLRSDYLAITTFGLGSVVQLACLNLRSVTGGPFGIGFIPRPFAALADRPSLFSFVAFGAMTVLTTLLFLGLERLARSPWGRVLRAIREDEGAAAALGKSSAAYRLQAFALGGALIGLGGALQAHAIGFIAPDNYLPTLTFEVWTMLIVGGAGSNAGAILGAVLIWALWSGTGATLTMLVPAEMQARAAALQGVAIGVVLCIVLVLRPRGLLGARVAVPPQGTPQAAEPADPGPAEASAKAGG